MQLGHGGVIASMTGIPCVSDFRIQDIILGGQGAPLVPMGDVALFSEFDACLNLGGICNISYRKNKVVKAYDIAPCNLPLNSVISSLGKNYDKNGALASRGKPDSSLLRALNQLSFYRKPGPKSLGREWLETKFFPVLAPYQHVSVPDLLFTLCEHIAFQIARVIRKEKLKKVLVSGGGAHHRLLIQRIQIYAPDAQIVVSDRLTTDFKEALIFAFLGLLRWQSLPNTLPSVTGAGKVSSSGSIWLP
jgi:anhydro-N-acetylmuramic acid kinase